jgi:adenylate cyclase class 2
MQIMSNGPTYREVEQKYPIKNGDFVKQKLASIGARPKAPPKYQEDLYFTPAHNDYLNSPIVSEWLRIRIEPDGASINYKCWRPIGAEVQTHCDEYETPVGDHKALLKLFEAVGFKQIVTVKKNREIFTMDEFTIALDSVEGLGDFIEVESRSSAEDVHQIHLRIDQLLKDIGAQLGKQDRRGYPYQLLNRER